MDGTSSGMRSIAFTPSDKRLHLSLPSFPARDLQVACTYAVVLFSILVQGPTVRRVLTHHGVGDRSIGNLAHS